MAAAYAPYGIEREYNMKRRNFLYGVGGVSVGGSALLGTGAFSRVESQRAVTIAVAQDPDAYLGLDKCNTPNGSYTSLDEKGHLQVLMNPDNPTIGDTPLGSGINSNSRSQFDNVFQICNQGKETVCVHIEDDEAWPETDVGERRVELYLGNTPGVSVIGVENAFPLPVGECVCVGVLTRSHGLVADDELLEDLDNEIRIIADVDGSCTLPSELPECPFYGTSRQDPTSIFAIQSDNGGITETEIGNIPDESTNSSQPNGLAYDPADDVWYFAEEGGFLKTMNEDGDLSTIKEYGQITAGASIGGAAFHDGAYYFIPQGGDTLKSVTVQMDANYGTAADPDSTPVVTDVVTLDWSGIRLGDLAVDRSNNTLYVSTRETSEAGANFFSVDLDDPSVQQEIANESDGDRTEFAIESQIAFENSTLWAHDANDGAWRTVDLADGSVSEVVAVTREYTDLSQCGFRGT